MTKKPCHRLDEVKAHLLGLPRVRECVTNRAQQDFPDLSRTKVEELVRGVLNATTIGDFYDHEFYTDSWAGYVKADQYGVRFEEHLWFVKVTILKSGVVRWESCHLAERDMDMPDGSKRRMNNDF